MISTRRILQCLLECFTFDTWFMLFVQLHFLTGRRALLFHMISFIVWLYFTNLALHLVDLLDDLQTGDHESFMKKDMMLYLVTKHIFQYDQMFMISMFFFGGYMMYIIHFTFFRMVGLMTIEMMDLIPFIKFHIEHRFTLLDRILAGQTYSHGSDFAPKIQSSGNLFCDNESDMIYLLKLYKIIEFAYFFVTSSSIFLLTTVLSLMFGYFM